MNGTGDHPLVMDRIEVLWELEGGRLEWWAADVLSITSHDNGKVIADGTIFYESMFGYDSQTCDVQFIKGDTVRPLCSSSKRATLSNSWRFEQEQVPTNTEVDDEWNGAVRPTKRTKKSITRGTGIYMKNGGEQEHVQASLELCKRVSYLENLVTKVMRRTANLEKRRDFAHITHSSHQEDLRLKNMKKFLRLAILRQFQKPIRRATTGDGMVDGGQSIGYVSGSIDCTLREFQQLSEDVDTLNKTLEIGSDERMGSDVVFFRPYLAKIVTASRASQSLYIGFSSLSVLCKYLGIQELSDITTIMVKEGKSGNGSDNMLRLLGTVDCNDETTEVCYFVSRSYLMSESKSEYVALHRSNLNYDAENRSFMAPLTEQTKLAPECKGFLDNASIDNLKHEVFTWLGIEHPMYS